jgi:hypothetical protein
MNEEPSSPGAQVSLPHPTKRKLLVLDGGGMRGLAIVLMLKRLKIEANLDLSDFDMIGGTSAGGLIALATLLGLTLDQIEELFLTIGEQTFTSSWAHTTCVTLQKVLLTPNPLMYVCCTYGWQVISFATSLPAGGKYGISAGGKYNTAYYQKRLAEVLKKYGDPHLTLAELGKGRPAVRLPLPLWLLLLTNEQRLVAV